MLLDILGTGPTEVHVDFDFSDVVGRLNFESHAIEGEIDAAKQNCHQEEIGGNVVASEPANH